MIITEFFNGQGLGNQLHCYVTTRCIALDRGFKFGIQHPERFKGASFMKLDFGEPVIGGITPVEGQPPSQLPETITNYYKETSSDYDPHIFEIEDNTSITGNLQGEKYFEKHKDEIREWLKVEPLDMDGICVVNFRGGEYVGVKDFFLPREYWKKAMNNILEWDLGILFEVHTDDPETAKLFFPELPIIHDIEFNWRSVRYAKYVILSNSSFGWFPVWLGDGKVIAPKYWGRYNLGYWWLEQNKTKGFYYQDYDGKLEQL